MGKKQDIDQLTNLMAIGLRHKIGAKVNEYELYADRYAKDAEHILAQAEKILLKQNWNADDKITIRQLLNRKLRRELQEKEFLDEKKYDIMETEMKILLKEFNLTI